MKKTLVYGAATAAVALSLGTCWRSQQPIESVYGPPPEQTDVPASPTQDDEPEIDEPIEDVYGPPVDVVDIDDESDDEELIATVYGPPPEESPIASD